jgi:hypothetical protein
MIVVVMMIYRINGVIHLHDALQQLVMMITMMMMVYMSIMVVNAAWVLVARRRWDCWMGMVVEWIVILMNDIIIMIMMMIVNMAAAVHMAVMVSHIHMVEAVGVYMIVMMIYKHR